MDDGSRDDRGNERRPADVPSADVDDSSGDPQPRVPDSERTSDGACAERDGWTPSDSAPGGGSKSSGDRSQHDRSESDRRGEPQDSQQSTRRRGDSESGSNRVEAGERIPLDPSLVTDDGESAPPERDPSPDDPGEDPDPQTVRLWAALLASLGVVCFLTAAAIQTQGVLDAALGAAGLGVVFLGIAVIGVRWHQELLQLLADGWCEHRRYVGFSAAIFGLGILVGAVLGFAGYDVLEMIAELTGEHPFEGIEDEELTAEWFIRNNSLPFALSIVGAVTLGLLTGYVMVFNGIIVGNVGWIVGGAVGVDFLIVGLTPHGIFELTALFIAAGVGFRLLYRLGERVLGRRESFVTKRYLARTAALVVFGWLLLALAAFVEAHVTGLFLDALYDAPETAGAANETASAIASFIAGLR